MYLIDSNIIVYSYLPQYEYLREFILNASIFVSEISRVEVLGYHKLTDEEEIYFKDIFNLLPVIFPSQDVFDSAITIRKTYNLKLGDSLIAATALVHGLTIYTRNVNDFEKVNNLNTINPISH
jgi:hypothetical protein